MKQGKSGATGPRGAKGARGAAGADGRRGSVGKPGQRGLKGLTGAVLQTDVLDKIVTHFEGIYQQLTSHTKRFARMQQQLDQISESVKNRR